MSTPERFKQILNKPIVVELAEIFKNANKNIYLVGGSVRDLFLGQIAEDLDFTTEALPDVTEKLVNDWADEVWTIGKEYGTLGLSKWGIKAEITTFRAEIYRPQSRNPKISYSKTIEEDLSRRDFTINSMAINLADGSLVDPYDGCNDLLAKRLKTPQTPDKSFSDDPLRMLRAMRFISSLGFSADKTMLESIKNMKDRLQIISKERIRDELSKLLLGANPAEALKLMVSLGLSQYVVPELETLQMEIDPQFHHKDVLVHTFRVIEGVESDLVSRLTALLHDIGKPATRLIDKGKIHFYGHDVLGAKLAKKRLRELRYPKEIIEKVAKLIRLHLRPYNYAMGWTDSAVRRYARDAGDLLPKLNQLAVADCTTRIPSKAKRNLELIVDLEKRIKKLNEEEEIAKIRAPIDGKEIMEHLKIGPGRIVGEALKMLLDAKLDDKIGTKDEAYKLLDKWAKEQIVDGG